MDPLLAIKIVVISAVGIRFIGIFNDLLIKDFKETSSKIDFFRPTRERNVYNRYVKLSESNVSVFDSYEIIETFESKESCKAEIDEKFIGNESEDAVRFKQILIDCYNNGLSFQIAFAKKFKAFYLYIGKFAPSHVFFYDEKPNLKKDKIIDDLFLLYQKIVQKEQTNEKTLLSVATMAYDNLIFSFLFILYENSIIGYLGGQEKIVLFIKKETILNNMKEFKNVNDIINSFSSPSLLINFEDTYIKTKGVKRNHTCYTLIYVKPSSYGFSTFLSLPYGKKPGENSIKCLKQLTKTKEAIVDLDIYDQDIFERFKLALNDEKTEMISENTT